MDIHKDWEDIKSLLKAGVKSNLYVTIATTNPDGSPHVAPIGSLMLYEPGHGVYADEYPAILSRNIAHDPRVCVMAVNSGKGFWLKSLMRGRFGQHPGIRLTGKAGKKRLGSEQEIQNWLNRVRMFKRFKGYELLWQHMKYVRDIAFDEAFVIRAGKMSEGLAV